jgi:hypothetical protein
MPYRSLNPTLTGASHKTLFFSSGIAVKIAVLFVLIGTIGLTGFAYMTKTNSSSDAVNAHAKIGSYVHIRKPGESGFRRFSSTDF